MIRGTITFTGHAKVLAKDMRAAVKASLAEIAEHWHARTLPGHFETSAESRYHYQARSPSYTRSKTRRFGHRRPLVFRGELKRQVTRMARVTSTAKGARVTLRGPKHLHATRRDFGQPDKAAELTAVTTTEVERMARLLDRLVTRRLNANTSKETVRI